ncbi:MAG: sortase [Chloroflexi bacterium]|nr:sortase [Chloroflexota bacterium]MBI3741871.1 sortase [Chloroflexota bacterium]
MTEPRSLDDLSVEELEALVEQKRRIERARQFADDGDGRRFRPVTMLPNERGEKKSRRKPKSLFDRVLWLIEIGAVAGLIAIIVSAFGNLQTLNQEVTQAKAPVTSAPGATGGQELPGSSFPPANPVNELPGSSFAPEPAPPALGLQLKSIAALPVPTPGPRSPTRIIIPAIGVDWPVVPGDSWEELKQGIGQRVGSANPGERGNLILSGHNDVYGEPFRDLEKLEIGKEVLVYAGQNAFRYVIKARRVVVPSDLSPLSLSRTPIITLITCTPYRVDTHRLIVVGELVN